MQPVEPRTGAPSYPSNLLESPMSMAPPRSATTTPVIRPPLSPSTQPHPPTPLPPQQQGQQQLSKNRRSSGSSLRPGSRESSCSRGQEDGKTEGKRRAPEGTEHLSTVRTSTPAQDRRRHPSRLSLSFSHRPSSQPGTPGLAEQRGLPNEQFAGSKVPPLRPGAPREYSGTNRAREGRGPSRLSLSEEVFQQLLHKGGGSAPTAPRAEDTLVPIGTSQSKNRRQQPVTHSSSPRPSVARRSPGLSIAVPHPHNSPWLASPMDVSRAASPFAPAVNEEEGDASAGHSELLFRRIDIGKTPTMRRTEPSSTTRWTHSPAPHSSRRKQREEEKDENTKWDRERDEHGRGSSGRRRRKEAKQAEQVEVPPPVRPICVPPTAPANSETRPLSLSPTSVVYDPKRREEENHSGGTSRPSTPPSIVVYPSMSSGRSPAAYSALDFHSSSSFSSSSSSTSSSGSGCSSSSSYSFFRLTSPALIGGAHSAAYGTPAPGAVPPHLSTEMNSYDVYNVHDDMKKTRRPLVRTLSAASAQSSSAAVAVPLAAGKDKDDERFQATWQDQIAAALWRDCLERRRDWAGVLLEILVPLLCVTCAIVLWVAFGQESVEAYSPYSMFDASVMNLYAGNYLTVMCYNDSWYDEDTQEMAPNTPVAGLKPCSILNESSTEESYMQCMNSTGGTVDPGIPVQGICVEHSGFALDGFLTNSMGMPSRVMPLSDMIAYQWMAKKLSFTASLTSNLLAGVGVETNSRFNAIQSSGKLLFSPSKMIEEIGLVDYFNASSPMFQYVFGDVYDSLGDARAAAKQRALGATWAIIDIAQWDENGIDVHIQMSPTALPPFSKIVDTTYPGGFSYHRAEVYYASGYMTLLDMIVRKYMSTPFAAGATQEMLNLVGLGKGGQNMSMNRSLLLDALLDNTVMTPTPESRGGGRNLYGERNDRNTHAHWDGLSLHTAVSAGGVQQRKWRLDPEANEEKAEEGPQYAGAGPVALAESNSTKNTTALPSIVESAMSYFKSTSDVVIIMQQNAYVAYVINKVITAASLIVGFVIVLAFLYPFSQCARRLVLEKERRIHEAMLIMGLRHSMLWWSWFLHSVALNFTISFFMALLLCFTMVWKSNPFCIFLIIFLFSLTLIPLAGLCAAFFDKSRVVALVAPLIYFSLTVPVFAMGNAAPGVFIGLSIISPTNFALLLQVALSWESGDGFAQPIFNSSADKPNTVLLIGFLILAFFVYLLLMLYFDAVLPKAVGVSKHPLFFITEPIQFCCGARKSNKPSSGCCGSCRCCGSDSDEDYDDVDGKQLDSIFVPDGHAAKGGKHRRHENSNDLLDGRDPEGVYEEETFSEAEQAVRIVKLRKKFSRGGKSFLAVNNFSWCMPYEGISVLLGHNGAGKSTVLNMMTGMLGPDAGDCFICGHSVRDNLAAARHEIGYCPQHNILWPDLTCREHLEFFARIKGIRGAALEDAVMGTLAEVDLSEKEEDLSKALSGGMKRKLSIAIAFVGGSRLVFLDEPTAGMDVAARRHAWELLLRMSLSRSVLLTTHFMDEADLLGDRVAIMSHGQLQCSGSSLFLKSRLGVGYIIALSITPNVLLPVLDQFLLAHVSKAERISISGGEVNYRLPTEQLSLFSALLSALDVQGPGMGIRGYALSPTTLEEVFLRIARESKKKQLKAEKAGHGDNQEKTCWGRFLDVLTCKAGCCGGADDALEKSAAAPHPVPASSTGERGASSPTGVHQATKNYDPYSSTHMLPGENGAEQWSEQGDQQNFAANDDELMGIPTSSSVESGTVKKLNSDDQMNKNTSAGHISAEEDDAAERGLDAAACEVIWNCELAFDTCSVFDLQSRAMMLKRWYNVKRDRKMLCFQIVCPVVCVLVAMLLGLVKNYDKKSIVLSSDDYAEKSVLWDVTGCARYFNSSYAEEDDGARVVGDKLRLFDFNAQNFSDLMDYEQDQWFLHGGRGKFSALSCDDVAVKAREKKLAHNALLSTNCSAYHEIVIAMTNFYNLWLRHGRRRSLLLHEQNESLVNASSPPPSSEDFIPSSTPVIKAAAELYPTTNAAASTQSIKLLLMGIIIMIPFTFLPSNCVAWVVKERECKSRHLQEICGARYLIYWTVNLAFDLAAYTVTIILVLLILLIFQKKEYIGRTTIGATVTLFMVFGFCSTATAYLAQYAFSTHSTAQSVVMAVGFISGFLLVILVFVLNLMSETQAASLMMRRVFRIFPTYAVGEGIVNLAMLEQNQEVLPSLYPFAMDVVGWPCVYMAAEGPLFLILAVLIDHPAWRLWWKKRGYHAEATPSKAKAKSSSTKGGSDADGDENDEEEEVDSDVEDEREEVLRRLADREGRELRKRALYKQQMGFAARRAESYEDNDGASSDRSARSSQRTSSSSSSSSRTSTFRSSPSASSRSGSHATRRPDATRHDSRQGSEFSESGADEATIPYDEHRTYPSPSSPAPAMMRDPPILPEVLYGLESPDDVEDAVTIVELSKKFSNGKVAVKNLTFGVVPGEIFGFLGTNGAGKTTTMSILCQEIYPTSGRVLVCGNDIVKESRDALQCIGYCPQFDATLDLLTVEEHLYVFAGIRGVVRAEHEAVVEALLQLSGLRDYRHTVSAELSGGNRRKLSVALALVGGPQVVIFDEPSAGMDPVARRELWTTIQAVRHRCSAILCTHHLEEVEALADCVGIMVDGRLRCIGSKVHLKSKYGSGFEMTVRVDAEEAAERASRRQARLDQQQQHEQGKYQRSTTMKPIKTNAEVLEETTRAAQDRVKDFILSTFPASKLNEVRGQRLVFSLPQSIHLADVFNAIQEEKDRLYITDYTVSQTSIEQIFMRISEEAEEAERIRENLEERQKAKAQAVAAKEKKEKKEKKDRQRKKEEEKKQAAAEKKQREKEDSKAASVSSKKIK